MCVAQRRQTNENPRATRRNAGFNVYDVNPKLAIVAFSGHDSQTRPTRN